MKQKFITKNTLTTFRRLLKGANGILNISDDAFTGTNIVVFFDRDKLDVEIPDEFKGFFVHKYDVRFMLESSNEMLNKCKEENVDLSNKQTRNTINYFNKTIELCKKMLQ